VQEATDLLHQCFKQNEWLDEEFSEDDIKECIFDSIDDEEAFKFSTLVVDKDDNSKVIGMHLALPLMHYINSHENWQFHKHFKQMEAYFEQIANELGT